MNPKTARLLWSAAAIVLVWAILFRNAAGGGRAVDPLSGAPLDPGGVGGGGGGFGRPQLL